MKRRRKYYRCEQKHAVEKEARVANGFAGFLFAISEY